MRIMIKKSVADQICRYWGFPLVKAYNPRDPKFEYFKRKIIAHLDKLEVQEARQVRKSIAYLERLEKARHKTYEIGETATWGGKKYIKGADKKWRRYYEGHSKQVESTITRLKGQARKCQNSSELWDLVFNNWGRFMDTDKMPLPIVREFHQYVSTIEDEINAGVSVENRTAHKAKRKRSASGAKRTTKPAGVDVKPAEKVKKPIQKMKASPAALKRKAEHREQADVFQLFLNDIRDAWNLNHRSDKKSHKPPQPENTVNDLINVIDLTKTTINNVFNKLATLHSVQLKMVSQWKTLRREIKRDKIFYTYDPNGEKVFYTLTPQQSKASVSQEAIDAAYQLFDKFSVSSGKDYKDRCRAIENKIQELYNAIDNIEASELKNWIKKKGNEQEALWARAYNESKRRTDDLLRYKTGELWKTLSSDERNAAYQYTAGSGKFNRPLSGFDGDWNMSNFKGEGNVNLNNESPNGAKYVRELTRIIEKSSYDYDIILRRGTNYQEFENRMNIPIGSLSNMDDKELAKFEGVEFTNRAFTSTGAEKHSGFSGEINLHILAPRGTKMLYTEPFSRWGKGDGQKWDGESRQANFSNEFEVILQRDTSFKIKRAYRKDGAICMDLEIVGQRDFNYQ